MAKDRIRIGVIGLGTVGSSLVRILEGEKALYSARVGAPVLVTCVSDRGVVQRGEPVPEGLGSGVRVAKTPLEVAQADDVDIVVELIGGIDTAREAILAAFGAGKAVVTANKHLLALHGDEIFGCAEEKNVAVGFEASVAGGIPILRALREGLGGDRVTSIRGILNGTCNYILTQMTEKGDAFADVLKKAQEAGYAEADPTFDVEGIDAAHKLALLAGMAFGTRVNFKDIYTEGISKITPADIRHAAHFGYKIKLLGIARLQDGGMELRVHPVMLPEGALLASLGGPLNGIEVESAAIGATHYMGPGAGGGATAGAVLSDIVAIARAMKMGGKPFAPPRIVSEKSLGSLPVRALSEIESAYYLRFTVKDERGVLAKIAGRLADAGISIAELEQPPHESRDRVPIVMLTHRCREKLIREALPQIDAMEVVVAPTMLIRAEDNSL